MGNVVSTVYIHGLFLDIFNGFVYIYCFFSFFLHKPKSQWNITTPTGQIYNNFQNIRIQRKKKKYQQPEQSIKTFRRRFLSVKLKSVAVLCFVTLLFFLFCWSSPQLAADKQQGFFPSSGSD